jgi:hypothetical protein
MKWLKGDVSWGPTSVLLGFLTVLFVAIFIWQLIESGDPADAGTRTSAIMTAILGGLFGLYRVWQATSETSRNRTDPGRRTGG